ncbi:hypothetical protein pb186bvf_009931 [Paramecium bursaria]
MILINFFLTNFIYSYLYKQVLQNFVTKKKILFFSHLNLPENFFCRICFDVCRLPILEDRYNQQATESCNAEVKVIFNYLSSYLQFLIHYNCDYCGKNINYWNSANHHMKCYDLVLNLKNFMANFQLISIQEVENCNFCDQMPFKPKQYKGKLVCIFCTIQNSLDKIDEITAEQLTQYTNLQIQCQKCQEIFYLEQGFIHFKKCLFNDNNYDMNLFKIYEYVKQLRKYQKETDKLFNINRKKHIVGVQIEKKLNLQINLSKNEQKRLSQKQNYLNQLIKQYEF